MTIKTIIKDGRTFRFDVQQEDDLDHPHPWNAEEGHGPVSEWSSRKKKPGEWVLEVDGRQRRFYDFSAAVEIAKRDGWGLPEEELADWIRSRDGDRPSKAMIARRAVEKDFDHLKAFCDDEWTYMGVIVTLLDGEDDTPTKVSAMRWGLETSVPNIVDDTAQELVDELVAGFGTSWGYVPKMVPVEFPNGIKPPLPEEIQDLHDAIHLLQEQKDHIGRECSKFEDRMGDLQVSNGKLHDANNTLRRENEALKYDVKGYRRQLGLSNDQ